MGMFGKGWRDNLATFGATMSDVGGALNRTGGGNLQALQARRTYDAQQAERKAAIEDFFKPAAQPGTPPMMPQPVAGGGYGSAGEAAKAGSMGGYGPAVTAPTTPAAPQPGGMPGGAFDQEKLARLALMGVDIAPFMKIREAQTPNFQGFNRDGGLQVFNPQTGKTEWIADPATEEASLRQKLLQAQIAAAEGKTEGVRVIEAKDGLYEYDPVTRQTRKLNSWAAYSPPRTGGRGGGAAKAGSHSLPSGFKVVQ